MESTFEESYKRLEDILAKLSSGKVPLDESLKMYEEADHLIKHCSSKLASAEQKIEIMIRNREGDVALQKFE